VVLWVISESVFTEGLWVLAECFYLGAVRLDFVISFRVLCAGQKRKEISLGYN